jgi:hypothetical protein
MKDYIFIIIVLPLCVFLGCLLGWLATLEPTPTLYECPCESEELIKDVVRHTNKDGMKSVTTFVDVKGCLIVKE